MDIINQLNKNIGEILPTLSSQEIEEVIKLASDAYYNTSEELISDRIYDILLEKLKQISPNSPIFKQIGAPIRGKKITLPYWMGSMNKVKSDNVQIKKWTREFTGPYIISDKLDGISCLLVKDSTTSTKLYTRGNGSTGQDVSHLLDLINISIKKLPAKISLRGELIMTKKSFITYKKINPSASNARNTVGGIVNSKISSLDEYETSLINFVAYEIIDPPALPQDQFKQLKKYGLEVVYYDIYVDIDLAILDNALTKRKYTSPYEIDGIIITDNNIHARNQSGNPSYSFAYKGLSETSDTTVLRVLWKPSKDGFLIPTIVYKQIRLSQANIQKTTGFNARYIKNNGIGPGAIITMIRSGDTIPYIIDVVKKVKPSFPTDVEYKWNESGVNIILLDANKNTEVIIQRLTRFMKYIGVENLSEGLVRRLIEAGYDSIPKIVIMDVEDFLNVEGVKDTLANKLFFNLSNALKKMDILVLMAASNIFGRGFGERKIKMILNSYPDIVDTYDQRKREEWEEKLNMINGFNDLTVNKFLDQMPKFQLFVQKLRKNINIKPYKKKEKKNGRFKSEVVVFTGFRENNWKALIEEEGGKVSGSVSKNTTLVVHKDGDESTGKILKAIQLGIKTMGRTDFAKKYKL